jgi:hypothetical protein
MRGSWEVMMLIDLFGYLRRNSKNWNAGQLKKCINEIRQIENFLERKLADIEESV